jgi:hypothetical protein
MRGPIAACTRLVIPGAGRRVTPGMRCALLAAAALLALAPAAAVHGATFATPQRIVGTAAADAEPPQLATSGNSVYLVWHEAESSTVTEPEIWFARSTNNGGAFGARVNISASAGVYSSEEQILASGTNVFIVWTEDDLVQKKVYFRRSINGGGSFSAKKAISDVRSPSNPRVTASGVNVIVAWQNQGTGNSQDIFIRQSKDTGANFASGKDVTNNASPSEFYFQDGGGLRQIAISGSKLVLTWRDVAGGSFETFAIQGAL